MIVVRAKGPAPVPIFHLLEEVSDEEHCFAFMFAGCDRFSFGL